MLAIVALCVGGLGIARAVKDNALGERILASCADMARASLAVSSPTEGAAKPRKLKGK